MASTGTVCVRSEHHLSQSCRATLTLNTSQSMRFLKWTTLHSCTLRQLPWVAMIRRCRCHSSDTLTNALMLSREAEALQQDSLAMKIQDEAYHGSRFIQATCLTIARRPISILHYHKRHMVKVENKARTTASIACKGLLLHLGGYSSEQEGIRKAFNRHWNNVGLSVLPENKCTRHSCHRHLWRYHSRRLVIACSPRVSSLVQ